MPQSQSIILEPGKALFSEGDNSREMYIIIRGKIRITKASGAGEYVILAEMGPGAMVGEMSLISGKPRSATARVLEETEVKVIGPSIFEKTVTGVPPWVLGVAKVLAERLRRLNHIVQKNVRVDALDKPQEKVRFTEKFSISHTGEEGEPRAFLRGYFFSGDIPVLDEYIRSRIRNRISSLTLDFSGVTDMDPPACRYLGGLQAKLVPHKIKLKIQNIQLIRNKVTGVLDEVVTRIMPPRKNVSAGEYIIRQNEESKIMYIIKSGRFGVTRRINGREVMVAEIGAGDVVGEMALIAGGLRSASVKALKSGIVYLITPEDINNNKFHIPEWFLHIIQQLIARIRKSNTLLDKIVKHEKLNQQTLGLELEPLPGKNRTGRFRLKGDFIPGNKILLKRQLVKLINNGFLRLILDFSEVTVLDDAYVSTFNLIGASLSSRGGGLFFINTSPEVKKTLKKVLTYRISW